MSNIYSQSIFMDSGAYSLYGLHVGETKDQKGQTGRTLDRVKRKRWGAGNYSFYDLSKGSEFRHYCDRYAAFLRRLGHTDVLFTTVDAIMNPEKSWEIQQYFVKEHGLYPVPVLHGGTPINYLYRYLETGKYPMIGFGGLWQIMRIPTYVRWADEMFRHLCPSSNRYLPVAKVHGFAMTSWELMTRWPWWSVDSATWIKLAAYGWIVVPVWSKGTGFRHDVAPVQINMSRKPTPRMTKFWWREGVKGPRQTKDRHYDNSYESARESVHRWLEHLHVSMGAFEGEEMIEEGLAGIPQLDPENFQISEEGATSCFKVRARVNLQYFKSFELSRPPWPHELSDEVKTYRKPTIFCDDIRHSLSGNLVSRQVSGMRIYFSGGRGLVCTPEALTPELEPHIMLTFHDIKSNGTLDRLNAYLERKGHDTLKLKSKKS